MESMIKHLFRSTLPFWLLACGISLNVQSCRAQTYAEFFRQKRTQEKYLLKQLAYLKLYADQAWKGYKLVSGGLETINGFTSGEMALHEAFLSALSKVGAAVGKDYRVGEIIAFQLEINGRFRALLKSSALSPASNRAYYSSVEQKIAEECKADLDELMAVIGSGKLEMNDAQRLSRLGRIHLAMREKRDFASWLSSEAQLLLKSQRREKTEIEKLGRLYGNN